MSLINVGAIERAERNVSLDNIDRISTSLGATAAEMLAVS
jgi:hypothetical protein